MTEAAAHTASANEGTLSQLNGTQALQVLATNPTEAGLDTSFDRDRTAAMQAARTDIRVFDLAARSDNGSLREEARQQRFGAA